VYQFSHHASHQGRSPPFAPHRCRLRYSRRFPYFPLPSSALKHPLTLHLAHNVEAKIKHDQDLRSRGFDTRILGLEKRACEKNGCKCAKNTPQGVYCELCEAVIESGTSGFYTRDSFECGPSGACCTYGSTAVCKTSNYASSCPR
jgi:hypothetical protein